MPHTRLEELAERWVPGDGPVDVQPSAGGLVNESCRVARAGKLYALRIAAADGEDLGLDRHWECAVRALAGAAGLAPQVRCCEPEHGVLVADWVTGRTWTAAEARLVGNIELVAQLLRRVHSLAIPQPARRVDPGDWIGHYRAARARHAPEAAAASHRAPLRSSELRGASDARLALLAEYPTAAAVLCHSDLHRLNLLVGDRTVLLDWEYAHVADGFWDLAGWVANNDWTSVEAGRLLEGYLQRPARALDLERLDTWAWLYDYVCLLWCELYSSRRHGAQAKEIAGRAEFLATRLARGAGRMGNGSVSVVVPGRIRHTRRP